MSDIKTFNINSSPYGVDFSPLYRGIVTSGALADAKQTGFFFLSSGNTYSDSPISSGITAVLLVYNISGTPTGNLRQQTLITLPNSGAGFQYGMYTRYIQSNGTALAWKKIGADQTNALAYKGLGNTLSALSEVAETGVLFISSSYTLSDSPLPSGVGGMLITINAGGPRIQFVTGNTSGDSVIFMRFISSGGAVGAWYDIGIDRNDLFGYKGQSSALSPASVADITQSGFFFVSASQGLTDMPISGQGGLLEVINLSGGVIIQKFYCTNLAGYPEFTRYKPSSGSFGAWRVMGENAPSVAKWVAFGDSITEGIGGSAGDPYVKRIAFQKGYNLTNKGAGGTGYIKVHEDGTATEQMSAFDFTGYDLCTIAYGTNDWRESCALGTAADAAGTNTVCAALKKCVEIAMTSNDAMKIIVILPFNRVRVSSAFTPTPSIDTNWCYGVRNTEGYTLSEMCDALIDTCKTLGVQYIDSRTESPINVYNIDTLLADELHPSDIGNLMIARNYADKITY